MKAKYLVFSSGVERFIFFVITKLIHHYKNKQTKTTKKPPHKIKNTQEKKPTIIIFWFMHLPYFLLQKVLIPSSSYEPQVDNLTRKMANYLISCAW